MEDLVRWLGAQLDEDKRIAREAGGLAWSRSEHPWDTSVAIRDSKGERVVCDEGWPSEGQEVHIAEHDPARVLREIDAKRRIIAEHSLTVEKTDAAPYDSVTGERCPDEYSVTCALCGWVSDDPTSGCLTLRLLALPYADRECYREEWSP